MSAIGNKLNSTVGPLLGSVFGSSIPAILDPANPDLLFFYTQDDADYSGATCFDSGPAGNDATANSVTSVAGQINEARNMAGNPATIEVPATATSNNLHWMGWVKLNTPPGGGQQIIYSDYAFNATPSAKRAFEILAYTNSNFRAQVSSDGVAAVVANFDGLTAVTGTWFFIDVYVNNSEIGISVDRAAYQTTAHTGGVLDSEIPKFFGGRDSDASGDPDLYANIAVDQIRLFNGQRTAAEADTVYAEGSP